jgi:hypothetical protein
MKAGTTLLLLLVVAIATACARTVPVGDTQDTGSIPSSTENVGTTPAGDATLVVDDPNLNGELTADPLEDIGTLDEMPVDDSIPK